MRLSLFLYGTGRGSRSSLCVLVIIVMVFPGCELNVDYVLVHVDLVVVAISSHYKRRRNCPFDPIDPALLDDKVASITSTGQHLLSTPKDNHSHLVSVIGQHMFK